MNLKVNSLVTVTKSKDRTDELNKFAGHESKVLKMNEDGSVLITHPFGLKDVNDTLTIPADRLKVLAEVDVDEPAKPAKKAGGKTKLADVMAAVKPGDRLKLKSNWYTVAKASPASSKTIVVTTSQNKERRIWRDKIMSIETA